MATICAGRTDRGVHATHQVVSIASPFRRAPASWIRGVNTFLPDDIAVKWACEVPEGFHARFDALSRTYQYWIFNHPVRSPVMHGKTGWVWRPLDAEKMHEAAQILVGEHDFSSFRAAECQAATPVRTVKHITVRRQGALIGVEISANAFLQHMVRNIVGSLIYVGTGRESVQWLADVLPNPARLPRPPLIRQDCILRGSNIPRSWNFLWAVCRLLCFEPARNYCALRDFLIGKVLT